MQREVAETIALRALGWLVGNDDLLPVFLGATGTSVDELKTRAAEPEFMGSILDFLTMDDAWVIAFCDATGQAYTDPLQARQALPGGNLPNWT